MYLSNKESAACGVGFLASLRGTYRFAHLQQGLHALRCVEHRGACGADKVTGDGAGIMTDIPFDLLGYEHGTIALATLFLSSHPEEQRIALKILSETFAFYGLTIVEYRDVPVNTKILGEEALRTLPYILQAIIQRPKHCRTRSSFDQLLYAAHRHTRTRLKQDVGADAMYFTSLSANTVVYKALVPSNLLDQFYLDLQDRRYRTRFVLFHRRFSTNTRTSWDKAQPCRLIGHNGEINTIQGNRSWAHSREKSLGVRKDELLTHSGISDSGSLNELVEALMHRSSIPHIEDVLAIMIPPAMRRHAFYRFWSRAMEPWDGPAFISYSDGKSIGARLDRNGFRPGRWAMTKDHFYLASEAGVFDLDESTILKKGALFAGRGVNVDLETGDVAFRDPSRAPENKGAVLEPRLELMPQEPTPTAPTVLSKKRLFGYTTEDFSKILVPMMMEGKEPIGSMGDTARLAVFSDQPRTFFDYFYQHFAQVTNPPLDYIREEVVTDLATYLGRKPNIFSPKELIPPMPAFELKSPILTLEQMAHLRSLKTVERTESLLRVREFSMCFPRVQGAVGFHSVLRSVAKASVEAAEEGIPILILSDREATPEQPPVPSLLMLRSVINALNEAGVRLETSVVVETAEARSTHHVATLIGFGATAVCPVMPLEMARFDTSPKLRSLEPEEKTQNLVKALEQGLLKIMAKMGISVVRSYHSAKLFTAIGLGNQLVRDYFPGVMSPIGGWELEDIADHVTRYARDVQGLEDASKLESSYLFKEHNRGLLGEKHSMTNTRSKLIHKLVRDHNLSLQSLELYQQYLRVGEEDMPINPRHLLRYKRSESSLPLDKVQSFEDVMKTFGSGAMSFGAISAESQRDLILAMKQVGGRSNSGEGGENPFYFTEGLSASVKQLASGRFGVTAEYLVAGDEIQIKIAQGAKPGEGGQLMAPKVNEEIARARHSRPHVDLISPPPLHDIYSIEDLKELIYELKQLSPETPISVKLVSGANIGTIAVGVVKSGADVVHIAGGDGGTGAASLSSMKHAGLPWEFGLMEVHRALEENGLRQHVTLRVDGGLSTGKDIVMAALMGAEQYDFGKLLLIAQGCVMARICEKNTCPTGIATHDPKFKAKYKGTVEHIVRLLEFLAEDVRRHLSSIGVASLHELVGRTELLEAHPEHLALINRHKLNLSMFLEPTLGQVKDKPGLFVEGVSPLNQQILDDILPAVEAGESVAQSYEIHSYERAALATLCGALAHRKQAERMATREAEVKASKKKTKKSTKSKKTTKKEASDNVVALSSSDISCTFTGSAGQGFGVFLVDGLTVRLFGEANDSFGKGMSGGTLILQPHPEATFEAATNTILGNCALYGATGGVCYANGRAGDRFAVRNSGALAVVEGTGFHACEYMTNGTVIILGPVAPNVGAGMTGGTLYLYGEQSEFIDHRYLMVEAMNSDEHEQLRKHIASYGEATQSLTAKRLLAQWEEERHHFCKYIPKPSKTQAQPAKARKTSQPKKVTAARQKSTSPRKASA
ncbi:MAG: glutamate synthase large subunit [Deltaproteobacteria bacterium]|nr:MAG: glutamate synthase large subunit [Deltaproteobacteria bacterium]